MVGHRANKPHQEFQKTELSKIQSHKSMKLNSIHQVCTDYQVIPKIREVSKYNLIYFGKIDPNVFLIISSV